MGDQFPKANIERARKFAKVHFKQWGFGYKCSHCNKQTDFFVVARLHFKQKHEKALGIVHISRQVDNVEIAIKLDLSGSKNMACGEPLCNRRISVLDMSLVGTRMFVYRYCKKHWKLHKEGKCESDQIIRSNK